MLETLRPSSAGRRCREIPRITDLAPRRILVKEVNWLGDLVISLPALRGIRAASGAAGISVLVREELAGFFDGMRWIDEVIPYRLRHGIPGLADQRKIISSIRQREFDLAVMFPNSFRSALWPMLARVPQRAGYATNGRGVLLTVSTLPSADALRGHQAHYWLEMLDQTLGISCSYYENATALEVSADTTERMKQWLALRRTCPEAPLIAIAPAAAYGLAKEWPGEQYAALIDLLANQARAECILVGGPSELKKCEHVASAARAHVIIAAGHTGIAELKALLSLCNGFAGNDSGAMHLAAALGKPTLGIFGSTDPQRTGPIGPHADTVYHPLDCSPCLQRTCRFGHYLCLRRITPEEVTTRLTALGAFARAS